MNRRTRNLCSYISFLLLLVMDCPDSKSAECHSPSEGNLCFPEVRHVDLSIESTGTGEICSTTMMVVAGTRQFSVNAQIGEINRAKLMAFDPTADFDPSFSPR
ncbi:hypothetical protein CC2G_011891 [Coprinopsis cinerea AmutBmut pab1-1]|nr:hypothetical protein CC2G_011891 [Coprinopsis cinerea AmutBmut pab1-1]